MLSFVALGIVAVAMLVSFRGVLSTSIKDAIDPYLPSNAAALFTAIPDPDNHLLHPWVGCAVFCGYAAVLLIIASILLVRRDA